MSFWMGFGQGFAIGCGMMVSYLIAKHLGLM